MPQVSKYPLVEKVQERVFDIFLQSIVDLKNKEDASFFLADFLSKTEIVMLAKRLSIAVMIAKNYDYRSICQILKVSPGTIARVNVWLKRKGSGYAKTIDKILRDEQMKKFWQDIDYNLNKLTIPMHKARDWSGMRKKIEINHWQQKEAW